MWSKVKWAVCGLLVGMFVAAVVATGGDAYTLIASGLITLIGVVGVSVLPWEDQEIAETENAFREMGRVISSVWRRDG